MSVLGTTAAPAKPATPDDVPGWFFRVDREVFAHLLSRQSSAGVAGDLLELGAYLGRSAILLGRHLQPGETFTVCDLFDLDAPDDDNSAEMSMSYRETLTRRAFESNYLAFHPELPVVVQAPTSVLADGRIPADSCRFVHIDASHLYEHVAGDILVARDALAKNGVVALDDYRAPHTPGVAAAVWEAVFTLGLRPVLLTPEKFYGTWGDPDAVRADLLDRDWRGEGFRLDEEHLAGQLCHRLAWDEPRGGAESGGRPRPQRSLSRRIALDVLPPVATRAVRRALHVGRTRKAA
ncbi:class I SAM-dependent methyltransferase [Streptomyces sp. TLI_171]|uniref:class I SAM-dependent methyltransferase n=1 Tax=Streptomyces sp. TLI_171 TaxID=1938859 RepID=UPI000C1A4FB1|nr:class I SAM-dependent methyltransferase [Streptomyces sp. TLI_171]RKE19454.1 methyltransferase family protein [Streptomyces sp. TLI_171]